MLDTIIIGAGPAGITAGIYAVRREMKTLIIGKELGGQIVWAGQIENYPGIKSIANYELINQFDEHLKAAGVARISAEVVKIEKTTNHNFLVHTNKEVFETQSVIVAMGLIPRRLAIAGEERLSGKGVSYCANCDGPLFKNKTIAVVGGGNAALDAAEVLSKIAAKVYLIHRNENFKGFDSLVLGIKKLDNVEVLMNYDITEIMGETKVEKIIITDKETLKTKEIELAGVFIEVGRIAHTDLVDELVERDGAKQIIIDEKCQTKTDGVFAAGDVTQVEFKQITIAEGQGTIAALTAYQYLQQKAGKKVGKIMDRSIK